ncbi:globin domain-containing protein [Williamsia muralis]|uniref:globin domain-containing protein n=1 Tax=Williamsia marianensis TaxID=85044 RepID=UPI0027D8CBB1|nr:globin domain-containing protein [Williamsia muralis]
MNVDKVLLERSLMLVADDDVGLTTDFYDRLFAEYPSARALFSSDIRPQARMLQDAIVAVLDHLEDPTWLRASLGALGQRHASWGVTPEMYNWVASTMIATMADRGGSEWTDAMTDAWSEALGAVAGMMLEAYPVRTDGLG